MNATADQAKLPPRQDPVLIIDKDGIRSVVNGDLVIYDDGRGMLGKTMQLLIALIEREHLAALNAKDQAISLE